MGLIGLVLGIVLIVLEVVRHVLVTVVIGNVVVGASWSLVVLPGLGNEVIECGSNPVTAMRCVEMVGSSGYLSQRPAV